MDALVPVIPAKNNAKPKRTLLQKKERKGVDEG